MDLWDFSVAVYARPGVTGTCLRLQNDHGLDVNLLLFCLWFARQRGSIPQGLLDRVIGHSRNWNRQIVQPLRELRIRMKGNQPLADGMDCGEYRQLRERIKSTELMAEKMQQQRLQQLAGRHSGVRAGSSSTAGTENLERLCTALAKPPDPGLLALLQQLDDSCDWPAHTG